MDSPNKYEAPSEWVISRVCEEFGCLPVDAIEALESDVDGLIFKILSLRSYAKAKQMFDEGLKETDVSKRPSGPQFDLVRDIYWDLQKARLAQVHEGEEDS